MFSPSDFLIRRFRMHDKNGPWDQSVQLMKMMEKVGFGKPVRVDVPEKPVGYDFGSAPAQFTQTLDVAGDRAAQIFAECNGQYQASQLLLLWRVGNGMPAEQVPYRIHETAQYMHNAVGKPNGLLDLANTWINDGTPIGVAIYNMYWGRDALANERETLRCDAPEDFAQAQLTEAEPFSFSILAESSSLGKGVCDLYALMRA